MKKIKSNLYDDPYWEKVGWGQSNPARRGEGKSIKYKLA